MQFIEKYIFNFTSNLQLKIKFSLWKLFKFRGKTQLAYERRRVWKLRQTLADFNFSKWKTSILINVYDFPKRRKVLRTTSTSISILFIVFCSEFRSFQCGQCVTMFDVIWSWSMVWQKWLNAALWVFIKLAIKFS